MSVCFYGIKMNKKLRVFCKSPCSMELGERVGFRKQLKPHAFHKTQKGINKQGPIPFSRQ